MTETVANNDSFFAKCKHFRTADDYRLIETFHFLEAAKSFVDFVELLGTAFIPVKRDIKGNIDKLTKIYASDKVKYKHLRDIVKVEDETLAKGAFHIGTDALLWLTRALQYNLVFLEIFYQDFKEGKKLEALNEYFQVAYDQTLKKYHNFFVQKIVSLCIRAAPQRTYLIDLLSGESKVSENSVFNEIRDFLVNLKLNIKAVYKIFDEFKVEY